MCRCGNHAQQDAFALRVEQMHVPVFRAFPCAGRISQAIPHVRFVPGQGGMLEPCDLAPTVARQADMLAERRGNGEKEPLGHRGLKFE